MNTQTLTNCDGQIDQHGRCDKCFQVAMTTSNRCGRLVPYQPNGQLLGIGSKRHFNEEELREVAYQCWMNSDKSHTSFLEFVGKRIAACASGAVGTVAEGKEECKVCGKKFHNYEDLYEHYNENHNYARKSSEGQP